MKKNRQEQQIMTVRKKGNKKEIHKGKTNIESKERQK